MIVTSAPLVESKIPGILKSVGNQVKTVIYAPFENHHKMLEKVDLGVDLYSFHDILDKGRMSKIKSNPNETITVDTIALIMYTSVRIFDVFVVIKWYHREQRENQKEYYFRMEISLLDHLVLVND